MDASNVPPPRGAPLTDSRRSATRDDLDAFDMAVGVACKSSLGTRENRRVFRKRPAAELRALVVVERLFELRTRVHDERAVLRDWLVDWTALQQQDLRGAADGLNRHGTIGMYTNRRRPRDNAIDDLHAGALEEVKRSRDERVARGRNGPRRAGLERNRPDTEVRRRIRCPRVRRRREWCHSANGAGNDGDDGGPAGGILFAQSWDLRIPEHREVRIDHLGFRRQVQPDLKELELVRPVQIGRAS